MKPNYSIICMLQLFFNGVFHMAYFAGPFQPHSDSISLSSQQVSLILKVFALCYFMEKEEKKRNMCVIDCNNLFLGNYDYIAFRQDYTGILLYSDYDQSTNMVKAKICDYDYITIIPIVKFIIMITITVYLQSIIIDYDNSKSGSQLSMDKEVCCSLWGLSC